MTTKYSRILGIFAIVMLVASFVIPVNMATSMPVDAVSDMDKGTMEWLMVDTPDSLPMSTKELYTPEDPNTGLEGGSEVIKLLVGSNGSTIWALVRHPFHPNNQARYISLAKSNDGGVSWGFTSHDALATASGYNTPAVSMLACWDMAIAPNDPNMIAVAISDAFDADQGTASDTNPALNLIEQEVWISTDGGSNWDNMQWPPSASNILPGRELISTMDISPEYGASGTHDILVGTRDGTGADTNNISTMKIPGFGGWNVQDATNGDPDSDYQFNGDVIVAKFSPTYDADSTIAVIYAKAFAAAQKNLLLATGVHDLVNNATTWQDFGAHIEIMNSSSTLGASPAVEEILTADLELPSDFSGQSASLRRFYISTDAIDSSVDTRGAATAGVPNRGIYRVDDNIVYTLMDTSTTFKTAAANEANRRISSIAYWGTYASGKLLAGEVLGDTCQAAVPTWFTDSPTVCPVPCWYPAKKPTSGAAGLADCNSSTQSYGNAQVAWSPTYADQGVAYVATGSSALDPSPAGLAFNSTINWAGGVAGWPAGYTNFIPLDESAFALTRNNGETWNQLSLIDTRMSKLTDVAPSADCTTVYLASANNATNCRGFDSVWRSSMNEKVVAPPLPALPIGSIWERVRVSPTATSCNETESQYAILRLAPDKEDGQIVFWAAGGVGLRGDITPSGRGAAELTYPVGPNTEAVAWSPDYGDYWADINPRIAVQDMEAESSTILYITNVTSDVQKMPYLTTAWSSSYATVDAGPFAHTIDVYPEDKVVIGTSNVAFIAFISTNGGQAFRPATRPAPEGVPQYGYHVLFDTDYDDNGMVYAASDTNNAGRVHRNKLPELAGAGWEDMVTPNTAHREFYGITQTNSNNQNNQGTLYVAHASDEVAWLTQDAADDGVWASEFYGGVERTLFPLWGIPKPGVFWSCLDAAAAPYRAQATVVEFTLEPKSLKHCGCLTPDTYTNLYAIDNDWYANNQNVDTGHGNVAALGDRGMLWRYIDCMAKKGPVLTMDDGEIIGCDPASGRNQEVNFTWEQLCIATVYQLQISKTEAFDQQVFSAIFRPVSVTSPALVYLSDGEGTFPGVFTDAGLTNAVADIYSLECGHSYFWRVKVRDETTGDQVDSPWSEKRAFSIKAGFRVTTPYYGPQLLAPDNGCGCPCEAPLCFSWSPFKETTAYRFQLSENPDMSSPLVNEVVRESTAYQYTGDPKCNTNYFWRVMAVEPVESEWSAVFSFMTQAEPPAPPAETPEPEEATPIWVWVIIAIGAILVIVTLVLIFKTRRV